jgi:hypothetical protein
MIEAPRVHRLPEDRVAGLVEEHELRDVGAAEDHRAGLAEHPGDAGVLGRADVAPRGHAHRRGEARHVERLFHRHREPVERAAHLAAEALLVALPRRRQRLVAEHHREGADAAIDGVDALQVGLRHLLGADFAPREQTRELGRRLRTEFVGHEAAR